MAVCIIALIAFKIVRDGLEANISNFKYLEETYVAQRGLLRYQAESNEILNKLYQEDFIYMGSILEVKVEKKISADKNFIVS